MLTTLLALATILADLCIGAAAYRLSKSNEKNQTALNAIPPITRLGLRNSK
jgi:hypothetical protein